MLLVPCLVQRDAGRSFLSAHVKAEFLYGRHSVHTSWPVIIWYCMSAVQNIVEVFHNLIASRHGVRIGEVAKRRRFANALCVSRKCSSCCHLSACWQQGYCGPISLLRRV